MITVGHLAQHILQLQPDRAPARLALYHYLIHHCDPEQELKTEVINRFVLRCLSFEHWQKNRKELQMDLEACLQSYTDTYRVMFTAQHIQWPAELQVMKLENLDEMRLITEAYLREKEDGSTKIQVLIERSERIVALKLRADHSFEVQLFPEFVYLKGGKLHPLVQDLSLHYDASLTFAPHRIQHLPIDQNSTARFRFSEEGCTGRLIRGYTFQKAMTFDGGKMNKFPILFYPIKRLEQLFINRKSDPMYVELVQLLEKAVELLRAGHPEAQKFARAAFDRGRLALEQIFPDDNLVRLLVNSLEVVVRTDLQRAQSSPSPAAKLITSDLDETWDDQGIQIL